MKPVRVGVTLSVALLSSLLLADCKAGKEERPAKEVVTLQLSWWLNLPEHSAFLLGGQGVFPKYGLNLKL